MNLRLASTFTDSLARLTGDGQKAVKTTAFDLQVSSASPGLSFHKLDRARDKHFWSVRVSQDIRIIVHKTDDSVLLCYVDHHDKAYAWAERRKLETHPTTGAAQIVEIRETVTEIARPEVPPVAAAEPAADQRSWPLYQYDAEALMQYGVPEEWVDDVRTASDETLFEVLEHLRSRAGSRR